MTDDTRSDDVEPLDSEARLARVLDKVGIGTFRIDHTTGKLVSGNAALARILGFENTSVLRGYSVVQTFEDPRERAEAAARIYNHPELKRTGAIRFEGRRVRVDNGEPVDLLMSLVPIFGPDGAVVAVDGLMEDIGARKQAEKSFRDGSERFRLLFEHGPVGMAVATPEATLTRVNTAFCRFVGRDEESLRTCDLFELICPEDRQRAREALGEPLEEAQEAGADPSPEAMQWRFVHGNGNIVWGRLSNAWLEQDGVRHSRVLVVQDITVDKQMEAALLRAEKMEAVGVLAGGIAHDFNNILASLLGQVELAGAQLDSPERAQRLLLQARQSIIRARGLTQQLVTFARGGSPQRAQVSIAQIASETADFCLAGTNTAFRLTGAPDLWVAEVDPQQVGRALHNLFINASEAMPAGGTVEVDLANVEVGPAGHPMLKPGPYVRISVRDQGHGVPPAVLPRIFDPYFTTRSDGTGLGLSVVLSIVGRHGGHIDVRSEPGQGATFTVMLPASRTRPPDPLVEQGDDLRPLPAGVRLLVMDDETAVREVFADLLTLIGAQVEQTSHGAEALAAWERARAEDRPFDLALLDLTIRGGMGGVETMARLKALDPRARAIVVSGYCEDPVMSDFASFGFADAVAKPFTTQALCRALRAALRSVEDP